MPSITGTWDEQTIVWGEANASLIQKVPVFTVGTAFYRGESGTTFAGGSAVPVVLERTGLAVAGVNSRGELRNDPSKVKNLNGMWPIIVGSAGDVVKCYAGAHDAPGGAVRWSQAKDFIIGTSKFVDFYQVCGTYLAVRFESLGMRTWRMLGYDLDIEIVGEH